MSEIKDIPEALSDLTSKAESGLLERPIGRESELKQMYDILVRDGKANILLLGPAGVGKTAIAEGLALDVADKKLPIGLNISNVFQLEGNTLMAGTMYRGQYEEKVRNIISFLSKRKDSILFIDEIHTIIGLGRQDGKNSSGDFSQILKPALARGEIKCIGATTDSEYESYIAPDAAFVRRFFVVTINELKEESVLKILQKLNLKLRYSWGFCLGDSTLKKVVEISEIIYPKRKQPDKAMDLFSLITLKIRESGTTFPISNNVNATETLNLAHIQIILDSEIKALKEGNSKKAAKFAQDCLGLKSGKNQIIELSKEELQNLLKGNSIE